MVIRVARKVWQPIRPFMPSSAARRWIIPPGVDTIHRGRSEHAGAAAADGAEDGTLAIPPDAGGIDIGVQVDLQNVVRRHFMALAAFFVQADPPALALGVIVFDTQSTTAPTRARAKVMTPINARSRKPTTVETSMLSIRARAWSAVSTGVLPRKGAV